MKETKKCPKCNGDMEEGETKAWGGYSGKIIWGQGGISLLRDTFKKNVRQTVTNKCTLCGYLESYAK